MSALASMPELVDQIDCSFCDQLIVPEVEDGDTAFECCCKEWHHEDCATQCVEYLDDLKYSAEEDAARTTEMTDVLTTPLIPGSEEWSRFITASKVSAILGLSPYDSPLSVWHKMKGNIPLEGETEDHRRGHYAEPAIIAWWRDQHPEFTSLILQPQYVDGDLAATPDAVASGKNVGDVVVEAKSARDMDEWGTPGTDEVPARYLVQTLFQLKLSGLKTAYIPVWGPWFEMEEYVVEYDEVLANGIVSKCLEFFESLAADNPPPLDDSLHTFQTLKALHPLINKDEVVDLSPAIATEFVEAADLFNAAEARKRAANSAVLAAMQQAQYAHLGEQRIARRQPGKGDSVSLFKVAKSITSQENQS